MPSRSRSPTAPYSGLQGGRGPDRLPRPREGHLEDRSLGDQGGAVAGSAPAPARESPRACSALAGARFSSRYIASAASAAANSSIALRSAILTGSRRSAPAPGAFRAVGGGGEDGGADHGPGRPRDAAVGPRRGSRPEPEEPDHVLGAEYAAGDHQQQDDGEDEIAADHVVGEILAAAPDGPRPRRPPNRGADQDSEGDPLEQVGNGVGGAAADLGGAEAGDGVRSAAGRIPGAGARAGLAAASICSPRPFCSSRNSNGSPLKRIAARAKTSAIAAAAAEAGAQQAPPVPLAEEDDDRPDFDHRPSPARAPTRSGRRWITTSAAIAQRSSPPGRSAAPEPPAASASPAARPRRRRLCPLALGQPGRSGRRRPGRRASIVDRRRRRRSSSGPGPRRGANSRNAAPGGYCQSSPAGQHVVLPPALAGPAFVEVGRLPASGLSPWAKKPTWD